MQKNHIVLTIDVFSKNCLSGWCVSVHDGFVEKCALIFEIGNTIIEYNDFNYRDDVKKANIGDGKCGFTFEQDFSACTVNIYQKETLRKIWTGSLGKQFSSFVKIELNAISCLDSLIMYPEKCLVNIKSEELSSETQNKPLHIIIYKTKIRLNNRALYYFQAIMEQNIFEQLGVLAPECVVKNNTIASMDKYTLSEYFVFPLSEKNLKNEDIIFYDKIKNVKINADIEIIECEEDMIYLCSYNKYCFVRPNISINACNNLMHPLFFQMPLEFDYGDTQLLKLSLLKCTMPDSLVWEPACIYDPKNNLKGNARNLLHKNAAHVFEYENNKQIDYQGSAWIYQHQGSISLAQKLYSHILQRNGDVNGIKEVAEQFDNILIASNMFTAIENTWRRFFDSDEFKNKKFVVLEDKLQLD